MTNLYALGRTLLGISSAFFGLQYLHYGRFVGGLPPVPPWTPGGKLAAWIPAHLFWVYFTGIGFIASSLAILTQIGARLAATMLGVMFLLWVLVLHAPRVAASLHNGDEWSSLFVALALGGGAFVLARASSQPDRA